MNSRVFVACASLIVTVAAVLLLVMMFTPYAAAQEGSPQIQTCNIFQELKTPAYAQAIFGASALVVFLLGMIAIFKKKVLPEPDQFWPLGVLSWLVKAVLLMGIWAVGVAGQAFFIISLLKGAPNRVEVSSALHGLVGAVGLTGGVALLCFFCETVLRITAWVKRRGQRSSMG